MYRIITDLQHICDKYVHNFKIRFYTDLLQSLHATCSFRYVLAIGNNLKCTIGDGD